MALWWGAGGGASVNKTQQEPYRTLLWTPFFSFLPCNLSFWQWHLSSQIFWSSSSSSCPQVRTIQQIVTTLMRTGGNSKSLNQPRSSQPFSQRKVMLERLTFYSWTHTYQGEENACMQEWKLLWCPHMTSHTIINYSINIHLVFFFGS